MGKRLRILHFMDNGGAALLKEKNHFLVSKPPWRTAQFESFGRCIISMQVMFHDGLWARSRYLSELSVPQTSSPIHFADNTLDGLVTFDKFQTIIDASLP
jgi:hypothetical protein